MLIRLFLLLTVVPLIELVILLRIGAWLGWAGTLGLVVATGAIGATLARREGVRTITRINEELSRGAMPTAAMADGVLILIAGIVLITPGVLTDLCGFALLIPSVRAWVRKRLSKAWSHRVIIHQGPSRAEYDVHDGFVDVEAASRPVEETGRIVDDHASIETGAGLAR